MSRKGFTLIELLVVIAIIAILAAILFPVFAQAREKARQSACLSNCNQIGKALMMYIQDNEGILPDNGYGSYSVYQTPSRWFSTQLDPYVKSYKVWDCPSARVNASCFHSAAGRDYGMAATFSGREEASFITPADLVLIVDCYYNAWYSDQSHEEHPTWFDTCYIPLRVHNGGATYVYADGHGKWSKAKVYNDPVSGEYRLAQ
jgi:prepilin-type N-terminal cleavage/methylation domain-containing protein/prepilin-type processing-associated H-X9-DG protein